MQNSLPFFILEEVIIFIFLFCQQEKASAPKQKQSHSAKRNANDHANGKPFFGHIRLVGCGSFPYAPRTVQAVTHAVTIPVGVWGALAVCLITDHASRLVLAGGTATGMRGGAFLHDGIAYSASDGGGTISVIVLRRMRQKPPIRHAASRTFCIAMASGNTVGMRLFPLLENNIAPQAGDGSGAVSIVSFWLMRRQCPVRLIASDALCLALAGGTAAGMRLCTSNRHTIASGAGDRGGAIPIVGT